MTAAALSFRTPVLPWNAAAEDERRFARTWRGTVGSALLFGALLPWLPVPQVLRDTAPALPPPVARMMVEQAARPPAPLPPPPAAATPRREATAEATRPPPQAPANQVRPDKTVTLKLAGKPRVQDPVPDQPAVVQARNPQADKPPGELLLEAARRKASGVGLLAARDQLADLRGAPLAVQMTPPPPGPGVGQGSGVGVGAGREPGVPERNMIVAAAATAGQGSGGIDTGALSRDTGGGGLAGRSTTLVAGLAGGGGGGGKGGGGGGKGGSGGTLDGGSGHGAGGGGVGGGAAKAGGTLTKGGGAKASRSIEEIRLVFERHKGAIYALYNRALRDEPGLQGKVLVELRISPDGHVAGARVVSSELNAGELEQKLLSRIRQFDFGAKEVEVMVVTWPVDFLPS
jgi:TonB family protein